LRYILTNTKVATLACTGLDVKTVFSLVKKFIILSTVKAHLEHIIYVIKHATSRYTDGTIDYYNIYFIILYYYIFNNILLGQSMMPKS
jgi:hypothetical protein